MAAPRDTALVYDEIMLRHESPNVNHIERPQRLRQLWDTLLEAGLVALCKRLDARQATEPELQACHDEEYLRDVREHSKANGATEMQPEHIHTDTYLNEFTWQCALLAAGSLIDMTLAVASGDIKNGFAAIRPPGHHCSHSKAMGFCLVNNVGVATRAAQKYCPRVLIVDWDVHHGNGTQALFSSDPSVLYFSVHRHDGGKFFPFTGAASEVGEGAGRGFSVNVPWPGPGFGDWDYVRVFDTVLLPIAEQFCPDLVIVSAGFDAAEGDHLGRCRVSPPGYAHLVRSLHRLAGGKIVLALEGGYNASAVAYSAEACVRSLLGQKVEAVEPGAEKPATASVIDQVWAVQREFWKPPVTG